MLKHITIDSTVETFIQCFIVILKHLLQNYYKIWSKYFLVNDSRVWIINKLLYCLSYFLEIFKNPLQNFLKLLKNCLFFTGSQWWMNDSILSFLVLVIRELTFEQANIYNDGSTSAELRVVCRTVKVNKNAAPLADTPVKCPVRKSSR